MTDREPVDENPPVSAGKVANTEGEGESTAAADQAKPARKRAVARGTSLRRPDAERATGHSAAQSATSDDPAPAPERPQRKPSSTSPDDAETPEGAANSGWTNYIVIAAAVVILAAAATFGLARPFAGTVDNRAFVDTALTTQVVSTAKQAAKDIYSIDMNNVGQWEQRMNELLTPGMVDEAKKMRAGITQAAGQLQDVTITVDDAGLTTGVAFASPDHAEVLLNVVRQVTERGVPGVTGQSPIKFVLDRFDGAWKVSSITEM
ncbi:hypothetical protein GCM10009551_071360 [Nocardiopsis tropica]|uniref:hypothetical protein n=1 Tax=Tsukamurella strandjordii TaxID=147577 RepID=UPI0031E3ACC0